MSPERTLSRIAKLIDRLSDQLEKEKAFPEKGKLNELTHLMSSYTGLLSVIGERSGKGGQSAEDILLHGRRGSYEELCQD
jgi:hypothetical protein